MVCWTSPFDCVACGLIIVPLSAQPTTLLTHLNKHMLYASQFLSSLIISGRFAVCRTGNIKAQEISSSYGPSSDLMDQVRRISRSKPPKLEERLRG
ncbi:hypothetical protein HD806DRAFT_473805 [Xylariaceae sp. AK1471]|nr:hypothetical protein HD806DRAFT_473805 [Xylariaceae sp. AK1471]